MYSYNTIQRQKNEYLLHIHLIHFCGSLQNEVMAFHYFLSLMHLSFVCEYFYYKRVEIPYI